MKTAVASKSVSLAARGEGISDNSCFFVQDLTPPFRDVAEAARVVGACSYKPLGRRHISIEDAVKSLRGEKTRG
jgi:hypothetical protein